METSIQYQKREAKTPVLFVLEKRRLYENHFDKALDAFTARLEYVERRSRQVGSNPDELLLVTTKAIIDMTHAAEEFERLAAGDDALIQEARSRLRERTRQFFEQSYFNRARVWPLGHPGDYHMIEFLYRNAPLSDGIGLYLDRYFLATTLSTAVRERKETLRDLLQAELAVRVSPDVLDIACGSCREVFELAPEIERSGARFTCIDFDNQALVFSADRTALAGPASEQITYRKYNAFKMINQDRNLKEFGTQDVIYSVGFFDYLEDNVLTRLLNSLYALLKPGGCLITSFKDCRRYRTFDTSWLLDWDAFYQRTEEDMRSLFDRAEIPADRITSTRERSEVIKFFIARK